MTVPEVAACYRNARATSPRQDRGAVTEPTAAPLTLMRGVSTKIAWRYSQGGDLMRTVDGRTWTVGDKLSTEDIMTQLAAVDATTAIVVVTTVQAKTAANPSPAVTARLRATHDGGTTWTDVPVPS